MIIIYLRLMSPPVCSELTFRISAASTFRPDKPETLLLHSSKGLAVSSSLFYPYREAGPTTLGWGPPSAFASGRFCSHLSRCRGQALPPDLHLLIMLEVGILDLEDRDATVLPPRTKYPSAGSARTFLPRYQIPG